MMMSQNLRIEKILTCCGTFCEFFKILGGLSDRVMKDSMETSGHDMSLRALNSLSLSYSGFTWL